MMFTRRNLYSSIVSVLILAIVVSMLFTSLVPYTTAHTKTEIVTTVEKRTELVPIIGDKVNPDGTIVEDVVIGYKPVTVYRTITSEVIVPHKHWYEFLWPW